MCIRDSHCQYAVCHSHLAATTAAVVVEPPAAVCALAQRSRAAAARTDWYAARRCRYSACRRRLAAARHCRYAVCHSHLAATTAAVVVEPSTAVCALTKRSRTVAARTDRYAARRCRYSACRRRLAAAAHLCWYAVVLRSIATFGDTACRMFAAAGLVCLFHRGRRLDDVAITITGGDTGPADVQEETAAAVRRRIFLAAHPPCNEDGG